MTLKDSIYNNVLDHVRDSVYRSIHRLVWDSAPYADWCYIYSSIYSSVYGSVARSMDTSVCLHVDNIIKSYDT
jgi:hypothetical protein